MNRTPVTLKERALAATSDAVHFIQRHKHTRPRQALSDELILEWQ
jgi:hypothetical protein